MTQHVKAKLIEISGWERDQTRVAGDMSHEGESSVLVRLADEVKHKLEDFDFKPEGLPFEYDFDLEMDNIEGSVEDEIKTRLIDEYASQFCEFDYVVPMDGEFEWQFDRGEETFLEKLNGFMNQATIVRRATDTSDCCGRSVRLDNVVTLPKALQEPFLAFVAKYRYDERVLADGEEHYFTFGSVHEGDLEIREINRDYDGFLETDHAGVQSKGPHIDLKVSMMVNGDVPRYNWRTGVVHVPGIQDHPVEGVNGLTVRHYGGEYFSIDHPWGLGDTTYVVFEETVS